MQRTIAPPKIRRSFNERKRGSSFHCFHVGNRFPRRFAIWRTATEFADVGLRFCAKERIEVIQREHCARREEKENEIWVEKLEAKEAVGERRYEEENREGDCCDVELFLNTATGAVEAAVSTKGKADV